jgi:hypothetical protein
MIGLFPQRVPGADLAKLAGLQPLGRQLAHLHQKLQIAPLRHRLGVRPLKDLDYAFDLVVAPHRRKDQQIARRVGGAVLVGRPGLGRNKARFTTGGDAGQQTEVTRCVLRVRRQQRLAHLDVVRQVQSPPVADHPHCAADGGQCRYDPLQERGIVLFRPKLALGQLSDFAHQPPNLLLGLFDGVSIDCLIARHVPTPFESRGTIPDSHVGCGDFK